MPNGSLEKFIYEERSERVRQLDWPILYQIALGIARGLEYLHRGCTTRILHFDIKPHNILLDEDFFPKISDFGLAKLCMKKESIVSMLGARGTIGYIAPEIVCRNLGGVSHKSDVYSYGMMVLEMVGGRKNVDVGVDRTIQVKGRNDSTCPKSFTCGNLTDLSFPFSLSTQPDCGIVPISGCDAKPYPRIQLLPGGDSYYALGNPFNYTVFLGDPKLHAKLRQHRCQAFNKNFSLPNSSSISFILLLLNFVNFFKCNITSSSTPNVTHTNDHFAGYKRYNDCTGFSIYYKLRLGDHEDVHADNLPANCSLNRLPIGSISDEGGLFNMLSAGFLVQWKLSADCYKCHYGGGQCQTDITNKFHCSYPNNPLDHQKNDLNAQDAKMTRSKLGPTLGAGARKMVMVSLWCIQTDPSNRPSMSKIVEMLEGKLDSLQMPPKPYLYSPSRTDDFLLLVSAHIFSCLLAASSAEKSNDSGLFHLLADEAMGRNDSTCPKSFSCGNLTDLSYPYSLSTQPDCGIMFLSGCDAKPFPRIQLLPGGDSYNALRNPLNYTVFLEDPKFHAKLRQHKCQTFNEKLSLPYSPSISFEIVPGNFLNFFKCNSNSSSTPNITHKMKDHFTGYRMYNGCKDFSIYYKLPGGDGEDIQEGNRPANCSLIRLPIRSKSDDGGLFNMLSTTLVVEWKLSEDCNKCHYGGGQCQTDITNKFHCTYPNNPQDQGHQEILSLEKDAKAARSKWGLTLGAEKRFCGISASGFGNLLLRITKILKHF
ncbi:hypothetical protein H5410_025360 [Solanum commersonii]|uniref:non-specific serine/threonine protein kinase n=1 Tax=Solanum commersonii TaxID=4109 RepID=A0A9J5YXQ9_SOLCO|nr:hypothetical protein H5410_025360 [Solanum commersonii]